MSSPTPAPSSPANSTVTLSETHGEHNLARVNVPGAWSERSYRFWQRIHQLQQRSVSVERRTGMEGLDRCIILRCPACPELDDVIRFIDPTPVVRNLGDPSCDSRFISTNRFHALSSDMACPYSQISSHCPPCFILVSYDSNFGLNRKQQAIESSGYFMSDSDYFVLEMAPLD
ncbi:hypothetical protein B0H19DRAFT_1271694 [Mycena capillaripes]|nr:hypothetical protein B0H19DRAFT_1271694 [Mycena capillaripes]